MSFLSGLFKNAVGFIPGVGPALKMGIDMVGDISKTASGAAKGAAAGRQVDTQNVITRDQLRNQQYGTHQSAEMNAGQLDMQRKNFTEDARGGRAKQALLASILGGGLQPTSINVPGIKSAQISGGLADSLKNPGAQGSMAELMKQALAAQMDGARPGGEKFAGGAVLAPPSLSALPQAGKLENIMGGVGLGGSFLSSILANLKKQSDEGEGR